MTFLRITSLSHPQVKEWTRLRQEASDRKMHQSVLIHGKKMVEEIAMLYPLRHLMMTSETMLSSPIQADQTWLLTPEIMKKITGMVSPEGVAAIVDMPEESDLLDCAWILCLDGVSDPGNMGTLLRTAFALGWEGVYLLPGCCDPYNDKALRAGMGATFQMRLKHGSHEELLKFYKQCQIPLYAADIKGTSLDSLPPTQSALLVLGSESQGLSAPMYLNSKLITIPMHGKIDSLNVAIAGGILLYTLRKGC